jgi:hydrogenase maturation protease
MSRKVLVAGVGNVFLGDDGFGVEVARRLVSEEFPDGVDVADFGIRGVHLAHQLLEGYDTFILIDAVARGEAPGTVFVIEPDFERADNPERRENGFLVDAHGLDPELVLGMVKDWGGAIGRVLIVGCEPAEVEERMGLSEPVEYAVDGAVKLVRELVAEASAQAPSEAEPSGTAGGRT